MSSGHAVKMGFREGGNWGSAFAQANTIIPFTSESLTKTFDQLQSQALVGQAAAHETENGHQMVPGDVEWELDFTNHALLKYAMGSESAGLYSLTNDLGNVFHLEIDKIVNRHRFESCRMGSLTISGDATSTDPIACSGNVIARSHSTNSTAISALSDTLDRVFFRHISSFRIGVVANALDSSSELAIKDFELNLDDALQTDGKDSSALMVLDPISNGFRKATLKIGVARVGSPVLQVLASLKENNIRVQAQLVFSNGSSSFSINMPQAKIVEGLNMSIGGPGVIEDSFTLELFNNKNNAFMATAGQFDIAT